MSITSFTNSLHTLSQAMQRLPHNKKGSQAQNREVQRVAADLVQAIGQNSLPFEELSREELNELISAIEKIQKLFQAVKTGGGFSRRFSASTTEKNLTSSVEALSPIHSKALDTEEEMLIRYKGTLIKKLKSANREDLNLLKALLLEASSFFDDVFFLIEFSKVFCKINPEFFCDHLKEFSLEKTNELLSIPMYLENEEQRNKYAAYFDLPTKEIEKNFLLSRENQKNAIESGNCLGTALSILSQENSKYDERTARMTRFIQADHRLESREVSHAAVAGEKILAKSVFFPRTMNKAASILGYQNRSHLLGAFELDPTLPYRISSCIGRMASRSKEIEQDLGEILNRIDKHGEIELKEMYDTIKQLLKSITHNPHRKPTISRNIEKNLHIKTAKAICTKTPLQQFMGCIKTIKDKPGKFLLALSKDSCGHAIYFSFESRQLCDLSDRDPITKQPLIRTFANSDELITHLYKVLYFVYPYFFENFEIFHYSDRENTRPNQHIDKLEFMEQELEKKQFDLLRSSLN